MYVEDTSSDVFVIKWKQEMATLHTIGSYRASPKKEVTLHSNHRLSNHSPPNEMLLTQTN